MERSCRTGVLGGEVPLLHSAGSHIPQTLPLAGRPGERSCAELGSRTRRRVHCPYMRGVRNKLGASHQAELLPQGCQQSQQCPGERGLWGRNLWEDGCGSAGGSMMHRISTC